MNNEKIRAEQIPVITITLDHLKQSIMHMLNPVLMHEAIESRLENAIRSFDFDSEVKRCADECIKESVERYFKYGEGNTMISNAVSGALSESLKKYQRLQEKP